jgi:hypothetical protein
MALDNARVKKFLGIPSTLTKYDETIDEQIVLAQKAVIDDSVASNNARYDDLVLLRVSVMIADSPLASLIKTNETDTSEASGDIKRKKVADVELEYFPESQSSASSSSGGGPSTNAGSSLSFYEREYQRQLKAVVGVDFYFGE